MRLFLTVLCALVLAGNAQAQSIQMLEAPQLSVTLEPARALQGGAYVQGELRLMVRVTSQHPFEALDLRLPEIENADVVTLAKPRSRQVRSYSGQGFVFETALALYPRRSGPLRILPVAVTGAVDKGEAEPSPFSAQGPSLTIEVQPIDPSYRADWWLVSESVTISDSWSKPPERLRVGDVVRRTVEVVATGATADRLRPPDHSRVRGLTVADAGVEVDTELSLSGAVARLRRSWDLRVDRDGVIEISPIAVAYWDPQTRQERRVAVPTMRLEPLPPDVPALASRLMAEAEAAHARQRLGVLVAAAVPGSLLILAGLILVWTILPTRADRRLHTACIEDPDPTACYRAVLDWGCHAASPPGKRTLKQLKEDLGEPAVGHLEELEAELFGARSETIDPREVVRNLASAARRQRLHALTRKILIFVN